MGKILIIDDSKFSKLKMGKIIKNTGHEVIEASDGLDALNILENNSPDLIFCDLLMPNMDGFQFLEECNAKNYDFKIIVMTADIQDTTKEKVHDLGAVRILNKPPKAEQVEEAIKDFLS